MDYLADSPDEAEIDRRSQYQDAITVAERERKRRIGEEWRAGEPARAEAMGRAIEAQKARALEEIARRPARSGFLTGLFWGWLLG